MVDNGGVRTLICITNTIGKQLKEKQNSLMKCERKFRETDVLF
jgi:hypothetical protein